MKTATELLEISQNQKPKIVKKVMNGVESHIIQRCEEEALIGATYYSISLNKCQRFVKDELLKECIELAHKFEDNKYKVSIDDLGNGYWLNFKITISWDNTIKKEKSILCHIDHLYDSDNKEV